MTKDKRKGAIGFDGDREVTGCMPRFHGTRKTHGKHITANQELALAA